MHGWGPRSRALERLEKALALGHALLDAVVHHLAGHNPHQRNVTDTRATYSDLGTEVVGRWPLACTKHARVGDATATSMPGI
mmetsp:Transcript_35991/g.64393  ORF Transcript_35991/g.64393 Transcript_35991/m.64393 type:complete len:82 (+) Transcript_35991:1496-1741(+)